jgi:hypothetical protein
MLAMSMPRKPAPMLAMWRVGARGRVGPRALGNAGGQGQLTADSGGQSPTYLDGDVGRSELRYAEPVPAADYSGLTAYLQGNGGGAPVSRDWSGDVQIAAGPGFTGLGLSPSQASNSGGMTMVRNNGDVVQLGVIGDLVGDWHAKDLPSVPASLLPQGVSPAAVLGAVDDAGTPFYAVPNPSTGLVDTMAPSVFLGSARNVLNLGAAGLDSGAVSPSEYLAAARFLSNNGASFDGTSASALAPIQIGLENFSPLPPLTLDLPSIDIQIAAEPMAVTRPDSPSLIVNPGSGLGVFRGALSATDAMYTRTPAAGPFGRIARTVDGYQAHHLNQDAVYRDSIPYRSGQSILLKGSVVNDAGSPHFQAHASLETWWDNYREDGPLAGQRPTNAQYGNAARQSLVDAGMSPADADAYTEVGRQQRLAHGLRDNALVPRVPGPINQPGNNVVDADLRAARGYAKNLAVVGRVATVVGAVVDGYSLYSQYQQSVQTGNYSNTYREGVRIAGGWAGAYAVGTAGAELGAAFGMAFTPAGAVIGGFIGGVIGGGIGYFSGSYASVGIATDVGLFPSGTPH